MTTRQISEEQLRNSQRAVATLRIPLDEFAAASGLRLEMQEGNLGKQNEVLVETDDGRQYMLVQHLEGPMRDIELRADETTDDPTAAVTGFLKSFGLPQDTVTWQVAAHDWLLQHEREPNGDRDHERAKQTALDDPPDESIAVSAGGGRAASRAIFASLCGDRR